MPSRFRFGWVPLLIASVLALSLSGCGEKQVQEEAPPPTAAAPAEEGAAAEETAAATESTTDTFDASQIDVQASMNASDTAAKAKNWEAATDNLLKIQVTGGARTEAESWQYNQRMTALQTQLIEAAEAGDPKAKAAIELLRKSRRVR